MRRTKSGSRILLLVFCLTAALSPASGVLASDRIADVFRQNPLLAAMNSRDRNAAVNALKELDAILAGPGGQSLPKKTQRSNSDLQSLLDQNPLLQEAYQHDPRATAKLIGIIRPAGN